MAKEKFDFIQPIKDIPNSLKGFPKNLIHIWKDPVTNSDEVKARKKEIFPLLYLFIGICLVLVILGVVFMDASAVFQTIAIIPGFGAVACVFLLNILKKASEKFADLECTNCKKRIAYDENVQVKVVKKTFSVTKKDQTIKKNDIPVESTISAKGKETTTVEITCKCQECGTEKTFTHDFVTAEWEKCLAKVPYIQSGALMVQIEAEVRRRGEEGFEGLEPRRPSAGLHVASGNLEITYLQKPEDLVKGYFGNEIQMR